jgi:hypothetical protein
MELVVQDLISLFLIRVNFTTNMLLSVLAQQLYTMQTPYMQTPYMQTPYVLMDTLGHICLHVCTVNQLY